VTRTERAFASPLAERRGQILPAPSPNSGGNSARGVEPARLA